MSIARVRISQEDVDAVKLVLSEHDRMLRQCLRVCTRALDVTAPVTGTNVQHARVYDEAKQWIGNMGDVGSGGPAVNVVEAEAHGNGRQGIGYMAEAVARDFFR